MDTFRIPPVADGAVLRQGDDAPFLLCHTQSEHEFDLVARGYAEQFLQPVFLEAGDDAAAPAARGGGELNGLCGDARVYEGELTGLVRDQQGQEAGGAFAGMGAAPVLERARPDGQRQDIGDHAPGDQHITQDLRVACGRRETGAVRQPFQIAHMQRAVFHEAAAGPCRGDQSLEIHAGLLAVLGERRCGQCVQSRARQGVLTKIL